MPRRRHARRRSEVSMEVALVEEARAQGHLGDRHPPLQEAAGQPQPLGELEPVRQ
jgi:hypothetical protein